ncbi:MAG TPA: transglutaminase domain-containing protein [Candidatus Syntrophoarchaeum butanivorans]|uniref:Transglutaminase domain-containing protein n=1 Tax=Candidatus Syntropharchaeum butanivorans TaxID=1839936 RepID=A0A1F2P441_9EURY|nr:MAG: Transglutaminase-like domain protein [Candidatus Syntrophoarchaeum butanivorans]HEC57125.1 transglutaminase domain-containing protein [Candidatus Syntrophoarchaeum butanivorans]
MKMAGKMDEEIDLGLAEELGVEYEPYKMSDDEVIEALRQINKEVPWEIPVSKELLPYLRPTILCEAHHPEIREEALRIVEGAETSIDAAMMIFYYMISRIKYAMEPPKTSPDALRTRKGNCFTKAGLQIALLRSVGIPGRYSFDKTLLKVIKIVVPREIFEKMPGKFTIHQSADAYHIERRKWIQCDTTFDEGLMPFPYNWNGKTDLLLLCPWWRLGHVGKSPYFPVNELLGRFKQRGFTKDFCAREIDPFTEHLRTLSIQELCKHYKRTLGRRDADSFAHILYFHFVGHFRDVHYNPLFRYDTNLEDLSDLQESGLRIFEPKYSVEKFEEWSVSGIPFEVE